VAEWRRASGAGRRERTGKVPADVRT